MSFPSLEVDALLAAASTQAGGLDDFGDAAFREPLGHFLASAGTEANLSEEGVATLVQDTVRLLVNRLLLQADLTGHPEIADEDVHDPIVIAGNPRTGTTKLQRMMAAHPGLQSVKLWQILFPARLPGDPDPRPALTAGFAQQLAEAAPQFMAAHAMVADEPEEEALILQLTFDRAGAHNWFYRTPSYHRWLQERDQHDAYAYLRETLQHLQWQNGGRRGPWVLKSPLHTGNLATLLDTFPNATVVHCHRNPATVVPSFCGLVEIIRATRGQQVDRDELGQFLLQQLAEQWEINLAQRAVVPTERVLDVDYAEIVRDPMSVIRRVLAAHGTELTDDHAGAIAAWSDANPAGKFGRHEYSLEQYGLDEDQVHKAFAAYYAEFGS
jgi:hypothetical protein